jgi:hypothetical protein
MRSRLLGIFTRDLKNKAFALFFAVTIWYFAWNNQIGLSNRGDVDVTVQVERRRGEETEYKLVRVWTARQGEGDLDFNNEVRLVLSGPQRDLRELDWDQVRGAVTVVPEECREAEGYLMGQERLNARHFSLPSRSLNVVEETITPNVLYFQLSPIVVKQVPVSVRPRDIVGRPPKPYRRSTKRAPDAEPAKMSVRGAEMYFGSCTLGIEPIDVTDVSPEKLSYAVERPVRLSTSITKDPTALVLVDETGKLVSREAAKAKVTVYFELEEPRKEVLPVKLWALVPLEGSAQKPFAVKCDPSRITVTFVGTEEAIAALKAKKDDPAFGLYFTVDPTAKFGEPITKSLTDLKGDPSLVPPGVSIERAPDAPGVVKVTLMPAAGASE